RSTAVARECLAAPIWCGLARDPASAPTPARVNYRSPLQFATIRTISILKEQSCGCFKGVLYIMLCDLESPHCASVGRSAVAWCLSVLVIGSRVWCRAALPPPCCRREPSLAIGIVATAFGFTAGCPLRAAFSVTQGQSLAAFFDLASQNPIRALEAHLRAG